ncbi:MAG: N-acetylglucosamine-6-phosphate deacetylase [Enterobacterales bacterium]|nr:N-acetylglucosamine-6-phosphate deacetylase [Enterobacterales bacterium]
MSDFELQVSNFYDGVILHKNVKLRIDSGIIVQLDSNQNDLPQCLDGLLMPGLIDLQVNGGGGVLFNDIPNVETLRRIAQAHQQYGTTAWLPTLVTDSVDKMQQAADAVSKAIGDDALGILGIHFEGPHISSGKKGVHSESFIRTISDQEWEIYQRKDIGKILLTLAPENVSTETVRKLVDLGVLVSIGHTNADCESVQALIRAGATGFTHLYNAMSGLQSRQPGAVGAALSSDCYLGIILDGIHCHPTAAKLAYRANPKLMLVTDAMPPVGTKQSRFNFFSQIIKRDGFKLTDTNGRLAGSSLDMFSALTNAKQFLDISFTEANQLASENPAKYLGLSRYGKLVKGSMANMILIDHQEQLSNVWIKGNKTF